MFFLEISV